MNDQLTIPQPFNPYVLPGLPRKRTLIVTDPTDIIRAVEAIAGVPLLTNTRKHIISIPRQLAMVILYHFTQLSTSEVGGIFKRDHCTVLHALKRTREMAELRDPIIDQIFRPVWNAYYSLYVQQAYVRSLQSAIQSKMENNPDLLRFLNRSRP